MVLPCTVDDDRSVPIEDIVPDFLRPLNVLSLSDFDTGWQRLYLSLQNAALSAGFRLPRLLRAEPRHDLDQAAVAEMMVARGFFSRSMNEGGGADEPDLRLVLNGVAVEDLANGRLWTRGCVDSTQLPSAPPLNREEDVARWTPEDRQTDEQKALMATRQ